MEIGGLPNATSATATQSSGLDIAETFDNFLVLLTTQLQYQDPLSPLDTNQFTEQLVQFTNVEQAIKTNSKLDQLIALQGSDQLTGALDYIGKTIEVAGFGLNLSEGSANITYSLAANAAETKIEILDLDGNVVRTITGATAAGPHELVWDGTDDAGDDLPDGLYGFKVTAVDASGGSLQLTQGTFGRVTGIEVVEGQVILSMGPLQVVLGQITAIRDDGGSEAETA